MPFDQADLPFAARQLWSPSHLLLGFAASNGDHITFTSDGRALPSQRPVQRPGLPCWPWLTNHNSYTAAPVCPCYPRFPSSQGLLGSVNDVSFTSDGRRLMGAGGDKRLLVWNTATGQVVQTLTGHMNAVSCVCCSPLDETMAVSAGEDRCLKVNKVVTFFLSTLSAIFYAVISLRCEAVSRELLVGQAAAHNGGFLFAPTGLRDCMIYRKQQHCQQQQLLIWAALCCCSSPAASDIGRSNGLDNGRPLWMIYATKGYYSEKIFLSQYPLTSQSVCRGHKLRLDIPSLDFRGNKHAAD